MNATLTADIECALRTLRHYEDRGFKTHPLLEQHLQWCLHHASGSSQGLPPAPLGLLPLMDELFPAPALLAPLIRSIQTRMEKLEMDALEYAALCA